MCVRCSKCVNVVSSPLNDNASHERISDPATYLARYMYTEVCIRTPVEQFRLILVWDLLCVQTVMQPVCRLEASFHSCYAVSHHVPMASYRAMSVSTHQFLEQQTAPLSMHVQEMRWLLQAIKASGSVNIMDHTAGCSVSASS